jgi:hypothetical protein
VVRAYARVWRACLGHAAWAASQDPVTVASKMSKVWRPAQGALREAAALVDVVAAYFERFNAKKT